MKKQTLVILGFIILFCSCATNQKIIYNLDDVLNYTNSPFKDFTLSIMEYQDIREKPEGLKIQAGGPGIVKTDSIVWYFNSDNNYKNDIISPWITEVIVKHLEASGLFKSVQVNNGEISSDLIMDGKIKIFDSYKERDMSTMVGQQFGLIGALATAGVKSKYETTCLLIEINIKRVKDNSIIWSGEVGAELYGEDYADPYGWSAYQKANEALKQSIEQLVEKLQKVNIQ